MGLRNKKKTKENELNLNFGVTIEHQFPVKVFKFLD